MLIRLNIAAVISETDNQDLLDLIDLEAKQANKKKAKVERYRQRKINLAQTTMASSSQSSLIVYAHYLLLSPFASADGADTASAGGAPLSPVASGGPLSAVLGRLSSSVASGGPLSAVSGRALSPITCGGSLSTVSGCFSSSITGGGHFSAVSSCPSSLVTGGGSLSTISDRLLYPVAGTLLSFILNHQSSHQYAEYKKLVSLVYSFGRWGFLVQNTLLQLIFFL